MSQTIKFTDVETNEEIEFEVVEETRVNNVNYLLVTESNVTVDASDDEGITTMEITHNNGAKKVINVNDKTAHQEVVMTEGETNYLIVTVTNVNGLSKTIRHKFDNF